MTTPPQIDDDVKEAIAKAMFYFGIEHVQEANFNKAAHHVQTLLNARLKEKDDLFKQSDIERRAFITDLESIIEGLRRELLSQALTIERMRAALEEVDVEIRTYHIDWSRFNSQSPDYDKDYKPTFPPITDKIKEALTAPPSDMLREVVQKVERIKLELNSWYGANHPHPKHVDAALSLCGEILKYLSTEAKP